MFQEVVWRDDRGCYTSAARLRSDTSCRLIDNDKQVNTQRKAMKNR
jgi:hypothetical protein